MLLLKKFLHHRPDSITIKSAHSPKQTWNLFENEMKMFCTSKIPNFSKFYPRKTRKSRYFWQQLRIENVLLIYFEQIVNFCAIIYSNTNSVQLFCENSCLNLANFTELVIGKHRHRHTQSCFLRAFKGCSTLCPPKI